MSDFLAYGEHQGPPGRKFREPAMAVYDVMLKENIRRRRRCFEMTAGEDTALKPVGGFIAPDEPARREDPIRRQSSC